MPATRYLGMSWPLRTLAGIFRKVPDVPYGVALERDGHPLLAHFCPPRFESMEAAVHAVVDLKYGDSGIFRGGSRHSSWKRPDEGSRSISGPDPKAIEVAVAYCAYVYRRYQRRHMERWHR